MSETASTARGTMRIMPATDSEFWRGALAWTDEDGLQQPWRLPPDRARRVHAPELIRMARMAAGVRLEMITDAASVELTLQFTDEDPGAVDVLVDGHLVDRHRLTNGEHTLAVELPEGDHEVRIWLPQYGRTRVGAATVTGASHVDPLPARPRWITYGSSITQCRQAEGPSETWPAIVALARGWDLICLGFAGQC